MSANLNIDVEQGERWVQDVQNELTEVRRILDDARNSMSDGLPDDSITAMLKKAQNLVEETWTKTCKAFQEGWKTLEDALQELKKKGQKMIDDGAKLVNEYRNN